ncbi:histidine phosphatase family protein [Branchiibius sp. NY16-3462-2]|uniref:SixA phosphatase family protein n=1 Tax=Branchiibius sp. NY16-3462-2 TaxID=1807500 RepID=UPI0007974792|nr:histidine phosphatase family protein [Branchiibius sp. NY16-3462-2]KYH45775.1 hypothetical protein AZH51_08770 [Branchiibius sp. NY16-3462-2]
MARTRRLTLIRHAKAEDPRSAEDHERALTQNGAADARALGHWLKAQGISPSEVFCSTSVRTRETWAGIVEASGIGGLVENDRRIYLAHPQTLIEVLREASEHTSDLVLVGHSPGVPLLAGLLADGQGDEAALSALEDGFPTCTAAVLAVEVDWADTAPGTARLTALHTARS